MPHTSKRTILCLYAQGALAVDAALAVVAELAAVPPSVASVLLAVDDYNVLYGRTDYGWPRGLTGASSSESGAEEAYKRKLLRVDDLTLVRHAACSIRLRLLTLPYAMSCKPLYASQPSTLVLLYFIRHSV